MAHSPHEEAEHASHHAQDPFDKRVAMSMVVIAAILAMVKVLGHRTHNDTLAYRIESGVQHTQASDQWNFFQAKKMREVLARQDAKLLLHLSAPEKEGVTPLMVLPDYEKRLKKVTADLSEGKVEGPDKKAEAILGRAEKRYAELVKRKIPVEQADRIVTSEIEADRYNAESKAIQARAEGFADKADKALKHSEEKHHQALFFDLGELGVELALVLSSIAILTKVAGYWYGGLIVCAAGLISIAAGFLAH
jgi:hypothetical protein